MGIEAELGRLEGGTTPLVVDLSTTDQAVAPAARGISFAVAGDIKVDCGGTIGAVIPSGNLVAGIMHPVTGITKIYKTGTTATGLVVWR
jgi:hypothetical protein